MTFTFYYDAGHGWLEVSKDVLPTVGLTEDDFSSYSYKDRDNLNLEEALAEWAAREGAGVGRAQYSRWELERSCLREPWCV